MTKLVEVLLGISAPSERTPLENIVFFDPTLNDSQKATVKFALEAPEVACIHGPPGIVVIPRTELNLNPVP
jgi:DNA polymerase alpha-associated DNA helicase A